jgi:hypothetical protein
VNSWVSPLSAGGTLAGVSRRWVVLTALLGFALMIAVSASALASSSSVKITGPSSVKVGTKFQFKISGFDAKPADRLDLFEASVPCSASASNETLVQSVNPLLNNDTNVKKNHSFSETLKLSAKHAGTHYLCAYLVIDKAPSFTTKAHAQKKWTDHS